LPLGLQAIIANALKKDRTERYQTAGAMRNDLKALKTHLEAKNIDLPKGTSLPPFRLRGTWPPTQHTSPHQGSMPAQRLSEQVLNQLTP
jgi:hypothetical protein